MAVFFFLLRAKKCVRLTTFQAENGSVQLLVLQLMVELSPALSARSGAPWGGKYGY